MTKQELETCISEYGRDIYSFCRYLTGDKQEADDLYQDTFLVAVERCETLELANNPKSYLLSVALRLWKNRKRKFAWRKRIADVQSVVEEKDMADYESGGTSPEEQVLRKEEGQVVRQAVDKLPERLRLVVLLFYMEELSTTEISTVMQIPNGTVLSRLFQARKLLRKELEDVLDEEEFR